MKLMKLIPVFLLAAVTVTGADLNKPPKGFKVLFNGKDLKGWWGLGTEDPEKWMALGKKALAEKKAKSLENIKQHFDMDEHKEKTKMFNLLKDVYCKARGFSVNDGFIASNYKFFILALKAYAMHHEGMTVSNCLSMLMSILDISQKQYKELYRHVDMLAKEPTPNYLCYCCNYAEYGRISNLSRHTQVCNLFSLLYA